MNIQRIAKHIFISPWTASGAFPPHVLINIEQSIKASEGVHSGEIRFVVEDALNGKRLLNGQSARQRALEVFSQFRIWDTEHNNGVLIYLLLADREVEIVADRGIDAKVGAQEWQSICRKMETAFKNAKYEEGVVGGIQAVTEHLLTHFPAFNTGPNQLPDKPVVLNRLSNRTSHR